MKRISRNVTFLGVVSGLTDISSEMLYPVVPLFLTMELGAPMAVVGLIEGAAEATSSVVKGGGGWLSDKMKRRKPFVTLGYSLSAVSKPLLALAATWHLVLFARFFDRMGKGIRTAPRDALIAASSHHEHRGFAFGFHRAMDTAGAAIGPMLSIALLDYAGFTYRHLFMTAFIPAILGVLILAFFVKERTAAEELASAVAEPAQASPLRHAHFSGKFKRLMVAYGIFALCNSSDVFLLMKAKSSGFSTTGVLLAYVVYNIVYAAAAIPCGRLSDRLGRIKTLAMGLTVFSVVYLGFAQTSNRGALWGLFMLYGLYAAMTEGVVKALVADLSGPENRGSAMGVFQGVNGILTFLASAVAGLLWTYVSPSAPFVMGAAGAGVCAMVFLRGFGKD